MKRYIGLFITIVFVFLVGAGILVHKSNAAAEMSNYCATPPFITRSVSPNVLIMLDNSASMYDLANIAAGETSYCYDSSYSDTTSYYGYYENDKIYNYENEKFVEISSMPINCTNTSPSQNSFCVKINSDNVTTAAAFKGNFLNWLTMSKMDVEKKVLTGGKWDNNTLTGESRGCVGRRFVKEIPDSGIVFAIRGSVPFGHGYDQIYVGGTTRIEIFNAPNGFNIGPCQEAISYIESGNLGQSKQYTDECLGLTDNSTNAMGNALAAFNHSMQTCWAGTPIRTGDINRMKNQCEKVYDDIKDDNGTIQWEVLDTSHAAYVCTRVGDNETSGYVGWCLDESTGSWDDSCVETQLEKYCGVLSTPEVIDPSDKLSETETFSNIPAILIDSGVLGQLGDPVGVLQNIKDESTQPTGILQNFIPKLRLGLMTMNHYGSKYEVDNSTAANYYYQFSDIDGGNIPSLISDNNTGIINSINAMEAYSWTPFAESFYETTRYFRGMDSAYNNTISYTSPIDHWCQKSFAVLLSDGVSTDDQNIPGTYFSGTESAVTDDSSFDVSEWLTGIEHTTELNYHGTSYAKGVAYWAHVSDLITDSTLQQKQNINFYTISALGKPGGNELLKDIAKYGGFEDKDNNNEPNLQYEWDKDNDGIPDNYFEAEDGAKLETALKKALTDILKQVSSGTAASILAASEKSGANILQAVFYPKKYFDSSTEAEWTGKLQNLWFYLGPFTQSIREDSSNTDCTLNDKCFNLSQDRVIEFYFDNATSQTKVNICTDSNGNGRIDGDETCDNNTSLEDITPIWEAGKLLWETDPDNRTIFSNVNLDENPKINKSDYFIATSAGKLKSYLDADNQTAENIINYIRGEDISGKRSRTVNIGGAEKVWKLGDIIYSTPKIVSSVPLNTYWEDYHDSSYYNFNYDSNGNSKHANRGMVFVGANDGMLHAFRFGKLSFPGGNVLAKLTKPDNGDFGSEAWGFIPQNILPYLKYYMEPNYCHLYYVDLTPYVFDASIGSSPSETASSDKTVDSWRTVLIGGLNFGGACGGNATGAVAPPSLSSPATGVGKSSYFAMDVTDTENPEIMWEKTYDDLGFTTTGPAIIHIPYKEGDGTENKDKNGYWYVAFASGPDDYDGTVHQPLYLYVLDLKTGDLQRKWQLSGSGSSCTSSSTLTCQTDLVGNYNAFAGRFFESQTDLGINYSDDLLYFGYTYEGSSWDGGVLRLVTGNDPDPANWTVSKLIDGVGPATSGVTRLEDTGNGNLWVYFGEGRYFTSDDDKDANRTIYGVKDPCYGAGSMNTSCTTLTKTNLTDVTDNAAAIISNSGWYINLDSSGSGYGAERVITDTVATTNGWVFYTTFMPTSDICGFGGNTYMWMVNYDNGGVPQNVGGVVFVQVSTGAIKKIELSKEFGVGTGTSGGRKLTTPITGAPSPSSGITVIKPPKPIKSLIQWRETPIRK